MLTIYSHASKKTYCFPARAIYKTTVTCPCPSCDISCPQCPDGGVCPHSEHGEGGGCVVTIKPGTGVWRLEEAAFNNDEQRAAAIADLPAYQEGERWLVIDEALPATANMAGWRLQAAEFECLGYFAGSTELQYCRCVDEAECCCADWLKQKEAWAKPDAPRRQAGTQRRAMLTSDR